MQEKLESFLNKQGGSDNTNITMSNGLEMTVDLLAMTVTSPDGLRPIRRGTTKHLPDVIFEYSDADTIEQASSGPWVPYNRHVCEFLNLMDASGRAQTTIFVPRHGQEEVYQIDLVRSTQTSPRALVRCIRQQGRGGGGVQVGGGGGIAADPAAVAVAAAAAKISTSSSSSPSSSPSSSSPPLLSTLLLSPSLANNEGESKAQNDGNAPAAPPRKIPDAFLCPITFEIMTDPVICADGHSYERKAIEDWLAGSDRSPMTNETLQHTTLVANHALRSAINDFSS